MGVEVINRLMNVVGVQAYDNNFPLMAYLSEALAYPIIEGSNIGIRRRQLQDLFRTPGYNPLSASGMARAADLPHRATAPAMNRAELPAESARRADVCFRWCRSGPGLPGGFLG
jgi:hypothetical protein